MDEFIVQQKARGFVATLDLTNTNSSLDVYLEAANAKLSEEPLNKGESGYTISIPGRGHRITINSNENELRKRFTICHEIAHIILGLPTLHEEEPSWVFAKHNLNETWCDIFAAELLMPYQLWPESFALSEPSFESIAEVEAEFNVSFAAAGSRYAQLSKESCAFVTMRGDHIRYAARSQSMRNSGAWVNPKTVIPRHSLARELRSSETRTSSEKEVQQSVWFENWRNDGYLWEFCSRQPKYDTTLSLLWIEPEELPPEVERDRFGKHVDEDPLLAELSGELPWPGKSKRR